jgi:hypothetical protein
MSILDLSKRLSLIALTVAMSAPQLLATPSTGEQIRWQVISGGGNRGTSTNFALSGSVGQTAIGPGTSVSFKNNSGFWQNFSSGGGCCVGVTGNIDCDLGSGIDISDLTRLVDFLYISLSPLCCPEEANVDGDPGMGIDISDLTRLIDYLYISLAPTGPCL